MQAKNTNSGVFHKSLTTWHIWAIPENIHTYTTDGFSDFRRGVGVIHDYGILRAWGGIYFWKSEGMGGFLE